MTPWIMSHVDPDLNRGLIIRMTSGPRHHEHLLEALGDLRDGNYIMAEFREHRRSNDTWIRAHAVTLDFDHGDPAEHKSHTALPADVWPAIKRANSARILPSGVVHPTRQGLRWITLLAAPIDDADEYREVVRAWGERVLKALGKAGIPLQRDGVPGLDLDECSERVSQMMKAPARDAPLLVTGHDMVPANISDDDEYEPPPIDTLPAVMGDLVREASTAIGCDTSFVLLPALATFAGAVGNCYAVIVKPGWSEPCVVWTTPIGLSGAGKTPAYDAAVAPVRDWQHRHIADAKRASAGYDAECAKRDEVLAEHKERLRAWEKLPAKTRSTTPPPPPPPVVEVTPAPPPSPRVHVQDTTIERLTMILEDNPRGLLLARDELSAWLQGMTKYSTSTDLPAYLEMSRAGNVVVDRVTRPSVVVRHAAVSITGTIQPRVWDAAMEEEVRAAGLPARILVARPPRRRKRWTDATVTIPTADAWDNVVTRALDLPYDPEAGPTCVTLSPAASAAFIEWFEDGSAAAENADDDTCAALSKLEGYGARIALVFHVMGALADRVPVPAEIPGPTMENAIRLCTWFRGEAERLYGAGEAASRAKAAKIIDEWGQARITAGDNVTLSIVTRRGPRAYRGSDGRAKAVRDLRAAKWAPEPTPEPKGRGRPPAAAWWPGGKRPARLAPLDPGADGALNGQARKDGEYPRHALQDPSAPSNADELVTAANRALAGTHGANEWPRSDGTCPACGHHECFNVHPENPSRWCCHSDSHGADSGGCGREAKGVWSGDALDLEVRARGRTNRDRIAVARDVLGLDQREVSA